jgi:hypothetical protein
MFNKKIFFIAEAGVNHNGKLELAKKLVDVAKDVGADCVKFQTFKAEELASKMAQKAEYQIKNTNNSAETQFEMLKKLELSNEDFIDIINAKNDSKNDKFVIINSKPINIVNDFNFNNSPSNDNKTRIKEQFKHYFNTSINLLKESANYISGNYKSI